jgi:hypothetical protein
MNVFVLCTRPMRLDYERNRISMAIEFVGHVLREKSAGYDKPLSGPAISQVIDAQRRKTYSAIPLNGPDVRIARST